MGEAHQLTIESQPYFSSGTIYRGECSCGKWISGKRLTEKSVRDSFSDHRGAKEANSMNQEEVDMLYQKVLEDAYAQDGPTDTWADNSYAVEACRNFRQLNEAIIAGAPIPTNWQGRRN